MNATTLKQAAMFTLVGSTLVFLAVLFLPWHRTTVDLAGVTHVQAETMGLSGWGWLAGAAAVVLVTFNLRRGTPRGRARRDVRHRRPRARRRDPERDRCGGVLGEHGRAGRRRGTWKPETILAGLARARPRGRDRRVGRDRRDPGGLAAGQASDGEHGLTVERCGRRYAVRSAAAGRSHSRCVVNSTPTSIARRSGQAAATFSSRASWSRSSSAPSRTRRRTSAASLCGRTRRRRRSHRDPSPSYGRSAPT